MRRRRQALVRWVSSSWWWRRQHGKVVAVDWSVNGIPIWSPRRKCVVATCRPTTCGISLALPRVLAIGILGICQQRNCWCGKSTVERIIWKNAKGFGAFCTSFYFSRQTSMHKKNSKSKLKNVCLKIWTILLMKSFKTLWKNQMNRVFEKRDQGLPRVLCCRWTIMSDNKWVFNSTNWCVITSERAFVSLPIVHASNDPPGCNVGTKFVISQIWSFKGKL